MENEAPPQQLESEHKDLASLFKSQKLIAPAWLEKQLNSMVHSDDLDDTQKRSGIYRVTWTNLMKFKIVERGFKVVYPVEMVTFIRTNFKKDIVARDEGPPTVTLEDIARCTTGKYRLEDEKPE